MSEKAKYIQTQERHFSAHHILLGTALMSLEFAREKKPGWFYSELTVITMCALALEALANAFGERFVDTWKHFESSSPIAKLRVVCSCLSIDVDFTKEPWSSVPWLVKFRNKVAHAKPEFVQKSTVISKEEYDNRHNSRGPLSKLESDVTLPNAERAYAAVVNIKKLLCETIPVEDFEGLYADGWSGSVSHKEKG